MRRILLIAAVLLASSRPAGSQAQGPASAGDGGSVSPAEAAEISADSEALEAERAAEARAGLTAVGPSEAAQAALNGARYLGTASPLRHRIVGAFGPSLDPDAFCYRCPMDPALSAMLRPPKGLEGLHPGVLAPRFDIPITLNDEVRELVAFFSEGAGRPHFARYLSRSTRFIPLMTEILASYGLPQDLVFVSMIESGFSTHAYSSASAVGPWQFIASTAEMYRLRMDSWVDERRDPVKATHAAAKFFTWLFREFEDWNLAWAGYNGGPGRVRRRIQSTGLGDYWALCRAGRLPSETCRYVPKIIAAAIISRHPERFGFSIDNPAPPFEFDEVEISAPTDLREIARVSGASFEDLKALNPELRRWITPPPARGEKAYRLRLPKGRRDAFLAGKDGIRPAALLEFEHHRVAPGDSLWRIARRYGCRVEDLVSTNGIQDANALRVGMDVLVPLPAGARPKIPARRAATPVAAVSRSGGTYAVQPGDTLWSIAQRHGVTTADLSAANGLADGRHVHLSIGQSLRIPGAGNGGGAPSAGSRRHVLQAGETLWQLSQRYGCSVDDLKRWNRIEDVHGLKVGQVLRVGP